MYEHVTNALVKIAATRYEKEIKAGRIRRSDISGHYAPDPRTWPDETSFLNANMRKETRAFLKSSHANTPYEQTYARSHKDAHFNNVRAISAGNHGLIDSDSLHYVDPKVPLKTSEGAKAAVKAKRLERLWRKLRPVLRWA